MGRERKEAGRERGEKGAYRYFFFPTSSPGHKYGLLLFVKQLQYSTANVLVTLIVIKNLATVTYDPV